LRFFINDPFFIAIFLVILGNRGVFLPFFSFLNSFENSRTLFCALFFGLFFAFLLTGEMFIIGF